MTTYFYWMKFSPAISADSEGQEAGKQDTPATGSGSTEGKEAKTQPSTIIQGGTIVHPHGHSAPESMLKFLGGTIVHDHEADTEGSPPAAKFLIMSAAAGSSGDISFYTKTPQSTAYLWKYKTDAENFEQDGAFNIWRKGDYAVLTSIELN